MENEEPVSPDVRSYDPQGGLFSSVIVESVRMQTTCLYDPQMLYKD